MRSLPRPEMCFYCEFNPTLLIITTEGTLLFTTTQWYIQIEKSSHPCLLLQYNTNVLIEEKRDRFVKHTDAASQNKLLCLT